MVAGIAFVAFCIDVMRSALAHSELRYALEASALAAYTNQVDGNQTNLGLALAKTAMLDALVKGPQEQGSSALNQATRGPEPTANEDETGKSTVLVSAEQVEFRTNAEDPTEIVLQIAGSRTGLEGLKMTFLPLLFAFNDAASRPDAQELNSASPKARVEVIGQPATRIGQAPPHTGTQTKLTDWGVFPLAIPNTQFAQVASNQNATTTFFIDVYNSTDAATSTVQAQHLNGAFVNLGKGTSSLDFYGGSQTNQEALQLSQLICYFARIHPQANEQSPQAVERGVKLATYDLGQAAFADQTVKTNLTTAINNLKLNRIYIFPVIEKAPPYLSGQPLASGVKVLGFAEFKLTRIITSASGSYSFQVEALDSIALPNASSDNHLRWLQGTKGQPQTAPVIPFKGRKLLAGSNSIEKRPRCVVLAPALSPNYHLSYN
jgi:hypothetical protein